MSSHNKQPPANFGFTPLFQPDISPSMEQLVVLGVVISEQSAQRIRDHETLANHDRIYSNRSAEVAHHLQLVLDMGEMVTIQAIPVN